MSTAPVEHAAAATPLPLPQAERGEDIAAPVRQDWSPSTRLAGLHRFVFAITLLNVAGHGLLGFENSWAHPLAALATGYTLDLLLEWIDARARRRTLRFLDGGVAGFVNFLLSAHISAMAVSMLLYPNERIGPVVFATALAITSKVVFRVSVGGRDRHVFNPSNFGIAVVLIVLPWVGIAPPYQFTENVAGLWDWAIPAIIICSGTLINYRYTDRLCLLGSWLLGFACQAIVRHLLLDAAQLPALAPVTGLAFLLFTFYMVTDPPTTPSSRRNQVAFGFSVAAVYGLLMAAHIVFGLFFSLLIVCATRGAWLRLRGGALRVPAGIGGAPAPIALAGHREA